MRLRPVWAGTCLAILLSAAAAAQESPSTDKVGQTVNSRIDIAVFHSESRQVLVGGSVWNAPWSPELYGRLRGLPVNESLRRFHTLLGLTPKDFRIFDNGVEQKINFFAETDLGFVTRQWDFWPTARGMWVTSVGGRETKQPATFYLLGYVPPALAQGECRTVTVTVQGGYMLFNRDHYCNLKNQVLNEALQDGTTLGTRMRRFAASSNPGSIQVLVQTFAFRSTGTVQVGGGSLEEPPAPALELHAPDFKYVVQVQDAKAPARIQIATAFSSPKLKREHRKDGWHLSLHVLGMVYTAKGELVQQFGDTYDEPPVPAGSSCSCEQWWIPRLYETQVDLSPGDYELRIVVSDGKANFGTARVPLRMERFDAERLSISDIALTDLFRNASEMLRDIALNYPATLVPTPLVSNGVQFFPADTRFKSSTPVSTYFEVYEPLLAKQDTAVYFEMKITDLKSGELKTKTRPLSAAKWVQPGNTVVPIAAELVLTALDKGSYRLEVRASDSAGRQTEWRQVDFTVN